MSKRKRKAADTRAASALQTSERPVLNKPPIGPERVRVRWFIWGFLLLNVLVPLKWYVGLDAGWDVDERFCWRMFSAFSMRRTEISLWETVDRNGQLVRRPLSLPTIMQPAWAKVLQSY